MINNAYILDNGGFTSKVGMSSAVPKVVPNSVMKAKSERRRPFVGDQVEECRDASGLFYILPFQKGYLVNWDIQKTIWDYMFGKDCCPVNFTETPLIVTEPYFNFPSIQEAMTEIFFEEYECQALLRINAGDLTNYHYMSDNPKSLACLVVDVGYSFSHVVPYIRGKKRREGIKRIDVGGKALTNHLKDIISYRQLNVMDETYVINQAKEDSCFVSLNFMADMEIARKRGPENTIARDYVLPDFTSIRRGFLRTLEETSRSTEGEQTLRLNNERFSVPEILFHPSDIGVQQVGIAEAIVLSIKSCPPETQPHLYANIVVTGGCSLFPNFQKRLLQDVRKLAPDEFDVKVTLPENPLTYAWEGGSLLSKHPEFYSFVVTKEEYEEEGLHICYERFDI